MKRYFTRGDGWMEEDAAGDWVEWEDVKELLESCKKLILHKRQGDLHPIDLQRIEAAISKAEGGE